jgi:hypothetical protein
MVVRSAVNLEMVGSLGVDVGRGVSVGVVVDVGVGVLVEDVPQISSNETNGGGDAWLVEPAPQAQPLTSPCPTWLLDAPVFEYSQLLLTNRQYDQ